MNFFSEEKISSIYSIESTPISEGNYIETYRARNKETNELIAIKKINILDFSEQEIIILINILKILNNSKHSIKFIECFKEENSIYIAMEFCESNLSKIIKLNNGLKLEEIKKYFFQINEILQTMRKFNIIHKNLKPENILLKKNEKNEYEIKISDYKLSNKILNEIYIAPEIILNKNNKKKVDLWSLGIILYKMYFNKFPFKNFECYKKFILSEGKKNLPEIEKSGNENFDDLIEKLIVFDEKKRLDWNDYFNHKFFLFFNVNEIKNEFFNFKIEIKKILNYLENFIKKFCDFFDEKIIEFENEKIEIENFYDLNKLFYYKFNENNFIECLNNIKNFKLKFEYKNLTKKNFFDSENLILNEIKNFNDHEKQKIFKIIELNNNSIATFSFYKIVIYDSKMNKKIEINLDKNKNDKFENICELKNNILCACTWKNIYLYKITSNNYNLHQKINFGTSKIFELKNSKIIFHDTNDDFHIMKLNNEKYELEFKLKIDDFYLKDYFELNNEKILCYPNEKNFLSIFDLNTKKIKKIKIENNLKTDFNSFHSHFILIEEKKLLFKSKNFIHLLNLNNFEIECDFCVGECENYYEISMLNNNIFLIGDEKGFINVFEYENKEIKFIKKILVNENKKVFNIKILKNFIVGICFDDGNFKLFKIE